MGTHVSKQRQSELRSLKPAELLTLVVFDRIERDLSIGEVRFIFEIAAERMLQGATDYETNEVLSQLQTYLT